MYTAFKISNVTDLFKNCFHIIVSCRFQSFIFTTTKLYEFVIIYMRTKYLTNHIIRHATKKIIKAHNYIVFLTLILLKSSSVNAFFPSDDEH